MSDQADPDASAAEPLFLLSFEQRDALARIAELSGWVTVAARRADGLAARFEASGAGLAVIDLRGGFDAGLAALATVTPLARAALALLDRADVDRLGEVFDAGASHYAVAPFTDGEFVHALRFAGRQARARGAPAAAGSGERRRGAGRDALTGLADAAAARRWLAARGRAGHTITLILIALERFEIVNAAFDRVTGDALLLSAARRVERLARDFDKRALVARMGGAEFAVGLTDLAEEEGDRLAAALGRAVGDAFAADDRRVPLAAAVGVARGRGDGAALLRRATEALTERDDDPLVIDLRRVLDRDEIDILFQPQVAMTSGAITGVEALARWRHPEHGEIGAERLFAAATRSGFSLSLSRHVRARALALAAAWPAPLAHLRLALNVTSSDIADPDFAARLLDEIDRAGIARERITIEITESGLIADLDAAARLLATLRAGGCRVAIDDFGTGYSSLAWLKSLPLDYLKLDAQLTRDITGGPRDRVVVRGVIEMARSLGLSVVAEGVETEQQRALLAEEGCAYFQGFFCSRPIDTYKLAKLIEGES